MSKLSLSHVKTPVMISLLAVCLLLTTYGCTKQSSKPLAESNSIEVPDSVSDASADTTFQGGLSFTKYDTPPTPIQNTMPAYPDKYRSSGIQGVVVLDVAVNADGTVGPVAVKKSLLSGAGGLDEAAVTAVKNWLFKPALQDNKPVAANVNIPIPFNLK